MGKMSDSIERADNRATMVFALGVVLASILFLITIGVAVLLGGALWIDTHYGIPIDIGWVAWGMSLLILPYAVTMMVDRNFGAKMTPGGLGQRIVRTTLRGYARIGLGMTLINSPSRKIRGRKLANELFWLIGALTSSTAKRFFRGIERRYSLPSDTMTATVVRTMGICTCTRM